jgi:hypothetical protein
VPIQLSKPANSRILNMAFACSSFILLCHSYRESSHHLHYHNYHRHNLFLFVCFLEESCLKGQRKLRETEAGLNSIMGSFMVANYAYLYARSSYKAFIPENGKVERNNVEIRIFSIKINYILMISYGKISIHLPEKTTLIRVW